MSRCFLTKEEMTMHVSDISNIRVMAGEENRQEFGDRVLTILKQQQRSKAWLAEQIGISKQAMNYLLNHSTKPKFLNEIAASLEVSPEWLKTGKGTFFNITNNNQGIRQIPLLRMDTLGKNSNDAFDEMITADSSYPPSCFAVKLENTSMEPTFNRNSILIFDPLKEPRNGDFIVFSVDTTGQYFFRQYFYDGDEIYLKSMDSMYKNFKNEKITIHGILIESRNQFK